MFHAPEKYRIREGRLGSTSRAGNNGAFVVKSPVNKRWLFVIASDGMAWEHVSIHAENEGDNPKTFTPYWEEMQFIKDLFWDGEDVVVQYHPRKSQYVNCHPNTLHLWRAVAWTTNTPALLEPPAWMVGPK